MPPTPRDPLNVMNYQLKRALFPSVAMFLSGAAALLYETLFFRLVGLTIGNSIVAMALVLAAFMGGLALGSALAGYWGGRLRNPLQSYCRLEILIAFAGAGVVLLIPLLQNWLTPLFVLIGKNQTVLHLTRGIVALLVMGLPATAMGATLPIMIEACAETRERFDGVLGSLYGWNTVGAFCGVIAAECFFIPLLGITGTGFAAAALNVGAMLMAVYSGLGAMRYKMPGKDHIENANRQALWAIMGAGFVAGLIFLSLEVIWFRLLLLFVFDSSRNFAFILSVVLASIGLGSLGASLFSQKRLVPESLTVILPLFIGISVILGYRLYPTTVKYSASFSDTAFLAALSLVLMLFASISSGAFFPLLGALLHKVAPGAAQATGRLAAANTVGGVFGALTTGYLLLPWFGMEKSLLGMAILCAASACLVAVSTWHGLPRSGKIAVTITAAIFASTILIYPSGTALELCNLSVDKFVRGNGEERVALIETPTQTVQYLRKELLGEPYYERLVTNNFSMSSTGHWAKRYMTLFAALPLALRPDAQSALLICYGCGNTARTLTLSNSLGQVDIVDVSREIVALGEIVFPKPEENPVNDPRTTVHIEDARFFLRTNRNSYDLITGEPPPPKANRIIDLYTKEYFQLMSGRLKEGGIATYWLPVHQLTATDARNIVRGFVEVFPDTSLWLGDSGNWIMLGVKGLGLRREKEDLSKLWKNPLMADWLKGVGIDSPAQLGSLYLIGGDRLKQWATGLPLTDDRPGRLSSEGTISTADRDEFATLMSAQDSWDDFSRGAGITGNWTGPQREEALPWFKLRPWLDRSLYLDASFIANYIKMPMQSEYLLWAFGSNSRAQNILKASELRGWNESMAEGETLLHLAARATLNRNYREAEHYISRALRDPYFAGRESLQQRLNDVRLVLSNN